jgi:ubiquinone/menaquinone biosynthesis C-methylase UbiE
VRTNAEWRYWGKRDPLWSVATTQGKERGGETPWTAEQFLSMGAADFADVLQHWQHYGLRPARCVEIGCGSGRMTKQLAAAFQSVLALDVSEHQIARAQELLGTASGNVEFRLVDAPVIPAPDGSCDAMFSCHVFQHLSGTAAVAAYLREAYRVLRPGGSACFHLPVPGAHITSPQSDVWYWARNLYKRVKRALGIMGIAEYHRYPVRDVFALLSALGFRDLELRIFAMSSNGDYHSYFLARKP